VPASNYADNFGMQWNRFRKTQLDSHSGQPISADRFWKATGWSSYELEGKWVLDVGCGAGRFAEVALGAGAHVVALDYSSAVDACKANLGSHPNLHVVQGDIYALPFARERFDFVYSLGVLQHTPNVEAAFAALPPMVKRGGRLCVDYYWKRLRTLMHAKYLLRPFTKGMAQDRLFTLLERHVPAMLAASRTLGSVPLVGRVLKRIVPVADYTGIFSLSEQQLQEWALLDTFDMLAPAYDSPQTAETAGRWFREAGFVDVEVLHAGHLVARGHKPPAAKGVGAKLSDVTS
jgi:2-polyprenyl-3-methyl-5-hydroxy-6-metoxy-1,4-benzoquinol methylase